MHVTYRRTTEADIEAEHAVFVAAEGELLERHGFAWADPPSADRLAPGRRHVLRTDGERCFVAEADDGTVVGYSGAFVRDATWFLSSLFVHPAAPGMGVGRRLFELAFDGAPARRITITDSIQPVSNALYANHGLLPITPILSFAGEVEIDRPDDLRSAGLDGRALEALDLAGYGFDRAVDHPYWQSVADGTLWRRDGAPVAYSYAWPSGRIGPIVGRDGTSAAAALRAELARGGHHVVEVPGTSRRVVEMALSSGLRLGARPGSSC
jgi:GNAT superfamily N-acetyltransferase